MVKEDTREMGHAYKARQFLLKKGVGYECAAESLAEDYNNDPDIEGYLDAKAGGSELSRLYRVFPGSLARWGAGYGNKKTYRVIDADLIPDEGRHAPIRVSRNNNGKKGTYRLAPDTFEPVQVPVKMPAPVLSVDQIFGKLERNEPSTTPPVVDPFAAVRLQIDEYIRHEVAMRVKVTRRDLTDVPDSDLIAELTRRLGEKK